MSQLSLDINNYPGSKRGSGVREWIINHIPQHTVTWEMFGGSGALVEKLQELLCLEHRFFITESSPAVYTQLVEKYIDARISSLCFQDYQFFYNNVLDRFPKDQVFIYADPPYIKNTRRSSRDYYHHEWNQDEHQTFLQWIENLDSPIIVSHYPCDFYDALEDKGWYSDTFKTTTRRGVVWEKIYMNYNPKQTMLASTRFVGENFTDRQRIKRKCETYYSKFAQLPLHERQAVIEAIIKTLP